MSELLFKKYDIVYEHKNPHRLGIVLDVHTTTRRAMAQVWWRHGTERVEWRHMMFLRSFTELIHETEVKLREHKRDAERLKQCVQILRREGK